MPHPQLMAMLCQLQAGCHIPRRGFLSPFHDSMTLLLGCIGSPQPWGCGLCSDSDPRISTQKEICNSEQLQDSESLKWAKLSISDRDKHNSECSAKQGPHQSFSPHHSHQEFTSMGCCRAGCARLGDLFLYQPENPMGCWSIWVGAQSQQDLQENLLDKVKLQELHLALLFWIY